MTPSADNPPVPLPAIDLARCLRKVRGAMKLSWRPNLTAAGRWVRAIWAVLMFTGSALVVAWSVWLALPLALLGGLALFEAARGWCLLRACGIRTRL